MVEILSRGIPVRERTYVGTCPVCQTRARFTHAEIKGKSGNRYVIDCPVCLDDKSVIGVDMEGYERKLVSKPTGMRTIDVMDSYLRTTG